MTALHLNWPVEARGHNELGTARGTVYHLMFEGELRQFVLADDYNVLASELAAQCGSGPAGKQEAPDKAALVPTSSGTLNESVANPTSHPESLPASAEPTLHCNHLWRAAYAPSPDRTAFRQARFCERCSRVEVEPESLAVSVEPPEGYECADRVFAANARRVAGLYDELIYAVGRKYPGESRHETALRYIRRMEEPSTVGHDKGAVNVTGTEP